MSIDPNSQHQLAMLRLENQMQRSSTAPQMLSPLGMTGSHSRHSSSNIYGRAPLETIPLHLINVSNRHNPTVPSRELNQRPPSASQIPISMATANRSAGVITSAPLTRRSMPNIMTNQPSMQPPPPGQFSTFEHSSTLEMLKARIASGQPIYTRGHRQDRNQAGAGPPPMGHMGYSGLISSSHSSIQIPSTSGGMSMGIGSGQQQPHSYPPPLPPLPQPRQPRPSTRGPKTKAIRSSQVPQSARYTAQEVDAMVDQVAHFPGNMVPCAVCQKYVKRERLRAHIHECHLLHGKRIVCPHCGIGLKSKGSFRVHIWRHKKGALPSRGKKGEQLSDHDQAALEEEQARVDMQDYPEEDEDDDDDEVEYAESFRSHGSED
jgi:hypothetical protein